MATERYEQTLDFLFNRLQAFHRLGATAYKPGLHTTEALSEAFGAPHKQLRVIHVGGTNGKGSVSHLLAAVLQEAGYRVGLYTSPHLLDFNERIRVNGKPISHQEVIDFTDRFRAMNDSELDPSFFELATVMAFEHFVRQQVDLAVVEVGLGGRLDSTNIVNPVMTVVTNISKDHTALLGDTLAEIATEKAGIFKPGVPAIVGESDGEGIRESFRAIAAQAGAPIEFADDEILYNDSEMLIDGICYHGTAYGDIQCELQGDCQTRNTNTVLHALRCLEKLGYDIPHSAVSEGFAHVTQSTGLMGRWMKVSERPTIICDTGHNPGAWQYLGPRLASMPGQVTMILGFVSDKDLSHILPWIPAEATLHFVQPSTPRAASAESVAATAQAYGLSGKVHLPEDNESGSVADGVKAAIADTPSDGTIFVGGSTFVVADFLATLPGLPIASREQKDKR